MVTDQVTIGGILTLTAEVLALAGGIIGFIRLHRKQEEIHVLVNSRYKDVIERVEQLDNVLRAHGIEIPENPHGHST